MTTCCFTSVFLKTLLTKGLVENWPFKSSEGWTLVNFKMFNAKACINKTLSSMKRRFLRSYVLNRVVMKNVLFHKVVRERLCAQKILLKIGRSHHDI